MLPATKITLIGLILPGAAFGQSLVRDINPLSTNSSASPSAPVAVGAVAYFSANDGVNGAELWKTDGTPAGTVLVKDINPTAATSSSPAGITAFGSVVVFSASDGVAGTELWKSDGTAAGTVLVADIYPGASSSSPSGFAVIGSNVYFAATDSTATTGLGRELYKYDGTTVSLVKDITVGSGSGISGTGNMVAVGTTLYFAAVDVATTGTELWKSDGTAAGTGLVKDINTTASGSSSPTLLTAFGTKVIFSATDGTAAPAVGIEPWISDGTAAGTVLLLDCYPGTSSSSPSSFTVSGGKCFFSAADSTATVGTGREMYVTNGTPAGTSLVVDLNVGTLSGVPTTGAGVVTPVGSGVLFRGDNGATGTEPFFSDGTAAGTILVKDCNPGTGAASPIPIFTHNGVVYMQVSDGVNSFELWKTNGTLAGTVLVKDIYVGANGSFPTNFASLGTTLLFSATNGFASGSELWRSDGTTAGTTLVKDINTTGTLQVSSNPTSIIRLGSKAYFAADNGVNGTELWVTDGTAAGTTLLKDINPTGNAAVANLTVAGDRFFFSASNGTSGIELWMSDGTAAGTTMVSDIVPGAVGSAPTGLKSLGNNLFFFATTPAAGLELWYSNGTAAGTVLTKDINGTTASSITSTAATSTTFAGNRFVFPANDGVSGSELWASDGTPAGTVLFADFNPGAGSSTPFPNLGIGNVVYSQATDGTTGFELFKSDGTVAGTGLVLDIVAGTSSSSATNFTNMNGTLLFAASDGTTAPGVGTELWKSNGTAAGTVRIADLYPGTSSSSPGSFVVVPGGAFFLATDSTTTTGTGRELYFTDGTTAGTAIVKDIFPGTSSGCSAAPVQIGVGKKVILAASSGSTAPGTGIELWVSNGTAAGTVAMGDLNPGTASSSPANFVVLGDLLLFSATNGTDTTVNPAAVGNELWSVSLKSLGAAEVETIGAGCAGTGGTPTIGTSGGAPVSGNAAFGVTLGNALASTPCGLYLSDKRADATFGPCTFHPSLALFVNTFQSTNASGAASTTLPIPAVPALVGVNLYTQWVVRDPAGAFGPGLTSFSPGLRFRIGTN